MYTLKYCRLEGLLGSRTFEAHFAPDANFLVGPNGTGKTTVINLLRLALQGSAEGLASIQFSNCTLVFVDQYGDEIAFTLERPDPKNLYEFVATAHGVDPEPIVSAYQYNPFERQSSPMALRIGTAGLRHVPRALVALRDHVASTWVSVHRHEHDQTMAFQSPPDFDRKTPIDARLDAITRQMTQYLARKDAEAYRLLAEYQRRFFISLIEAPVVDRKFAAESAHFDKRLTSVFGHLGLATEQYKDLLSEHLNRVDRALASNQAGDTPLADQITIANQAKLEELLFAYEDVERQRAFIYNGKDMLLGVFQNLYRGKHFFFDQSNQPAFAIPKKEGIDFIEPTGLSSGEKQLYIFLAETVLQDGKRYIYLADEPEISLHLAWQNGLVRNIRSINPNAQIIFATHSPEILAEFGDRALDMASHLRDD